MTIHFTPEFVKKLKKIRNTKTKESFHKQLRLFEQDIHHPSLKLHKLKGKRSEQYAIWIEANIRALAIQDGDMFIFFDIVTHDQY